MQRRGFIKQTGLTALGLVAAPSALAALQPYKDLVIGHGTHRYKIDMDWGALDSSKYPVNDCHEMVQDSKGRIVLLTNHTQNNVIIYDTSGKLIETWGTEFPGAHGLTLNVENGEDFLYISDNARHEVIKTTLEGQIVQVFPYPADSGKYEKPEQYIPTETAVAANGDVYVADGYGLQYIMHYNAKGELLNVFGGRGATDAHFNNAHGICIDNRDANNPSLLITARQQNSLKRFSMDGKYLERYDFPGAFICRPVIQGNQVYLATIWSGDGSEGTGFVSILDEKNRLVSAPGGCRPHYTDKGLTPMYQTVKVFQHPHDVCVDQDENLYVAQWNAGKTYPIKLIRQ
ncbi:NHL repeat-containing protein [Sediminicola luteus]|uniref:6-bladed beta-propeller n=1 Tax=Sediminicola luteus TaxID=319238 RepID=A0A2A4GC17_9FLAO|nr:6-bladed beta-propeller [Sediminicola luteus]PCE66499.1 6-bladed beta-propeller [Sediminicola luteus]